MAICRTTRLFPVRGTIIKEKEARINAQVRGKWEREKGGISGTTRAVGHLRQASEGNTVGLNGGFGLKKTYLRRLSESNFDRMLPPVVT